VSQYAIESNRESGFVTVFPDLQKYIKTGTLLYASNGKDMFGNDYGPFTVDVTPKVAPATFDTLSDVVDPEFWGPYTR
jgi:hypothetical protein